MNRYVVCVVQNGVLMYVNSVELLVNGRSRVKEKETSHRITFLRDPCKAVRMSLDYAKAVAVLVGPDATYHLSVTCNFDSKAPAEEVAE